MRRKAANRIKLPMTRYYFHVCDHSGVSLDPDGVVLKDIATARRHAVIGARSLICDDIRRGILDLRGSIEVTDGHDKRVLVVRFQDAVLRTV
jgi:hypothetical protein